MVQAAGPANNHVAQGISFAYDAAGRRTRITYLNGVTRNDQYDDAGNLTAIVFRNADDSVLGDLVYTYDLAGRRVSTGGSLARTNLPDALANVSVDISNRLLAAGAASLVYDANGNLTGDGVHTYIWNARDQLVRIEDGAGSVVASFTYDALGRRQTKAAGGVGTVYVYDGANIVQELEGVTGGIVRANYISGRTDEVFAQLTGSGAGANALSYLTDAQGSVIRMLDAAGAKVVDYSYDPYGDTTADAAVSNPFQYTGRENDGTGLYYYRARYYSPKLARFISSDPIGLGGGINPYAYVGGDPISFTDPFGLAPGESYMSAKLAGMNAIRDINPRSIAEGTEYAGRIYRREDGFYSYTPPNAGTRSESYPGTCPEGTTNAGDYHTHGSADRGFNNNIFSPMDMDVNDEENVPGFMGNPRGEIKMYTPGAPHGIRFPVIIGTGAL